MSWLNTITDLVERYSGQGGGAASAPQNPHLDYERATQTAPPNVVADGLAQSFRSDRTPPFPEMISHMFGQSDPNQRAGLLNRLLASAGPGVLAALPGLSGLLRGGGALTPEQASQVTPEQARQIAAHAEKQDPSVVDRVSSFYAEHPQVVQALGGLALTVALQHMMRNR